MTWLRDGWGRLRLGLRGFGAGMAGSLAVVVIALGVIGWLVHRNLHAIDLLVERLIEVEEPMRTAAYEMEINVLGCGLGVWKYLGTGDAEHRERVHKDQADFQHFRAVYGQLAATPVERALVDRLDTLWAQYSELCNTLMATRDDHVGLLEKVTATIGAIDRILDEHVQPDIESGAPTSLPTLLASTSIEADVAEIGAAVGAYTAVATPQHHQLVLAAAKEAIESVAAFLALPLAAAARNHGERIRSLLEQTIATIAQSASMQDALRGQSSTFIDVRVRMDDLLDEGIQILAQRDLAAAQPRARSAIDRLYTVSLFLLALGAVVAVLSIGLLAYRSVQLHTANRGLQEEMDRRKQSESARTRLFAELVSVQEKERGRLARELHDQMGQNLSALKLGLNSLSRALDGQPASASAQLVELQTFTGSLIEQVHTIAFELRPAALDDLGIHGVLSNHLDDWMRLTGVKVDFESNLEGRRLPAPVEIAIYRVAQEALTNVMKHAQAHNVSVTLHQRDAEVVMVVDDDGCGFDPAAERLGSEARDHLGLSGMRERTALAGGQFDVESAPGAGTTLVVRIPIGESA